MVLVVATYGGPELWGLAARPHLILPARVDPRGLTGPTEAMTRTASWRRSSPGRYVPASVALTTEQRIVEAACLLPEYGGVTGWGELHRGGGGGRVCGGRARGAPPA